MNTQQPTNKLVTLAAVMLVAAGVVRIPNGLEMRAVIRFLTEIGIFIGLAGYVYLYVDRWMGVLIVLVAVVSFYPVPEPKLMYYRRDAIFIGCAWYVMMYHFATEKILTAIRIIAIVNAVFGLFQFFGIDPFNIFTVGLFKSTVKGLPSGLLTNSNELAVLMAISIPLFVSDKWEWFLPVVLSVLFFTKSSGAALAVISALICFLIHKRQWWFAVLSLSIIPAFVFYFDFGVGESIMARLGFLEAGAETFMSHPFGVGLGQWPEYINQLHAHNDIAQMAVELGFIFPIITIGLIWTHFRSSQVRGKMIFCSIIVLSCFSYVWFMPILAISMVSMMAMMRRGIL